MLALLFLQALTTTALFWSVFQSQVQELRRRSNLSFTSLCIFNYRFQPLVHSFQPAFAYVCTMFLLLLMMIAGDDVGRQILRQSAFYLKSERASELQTLSLCLGD